MKAIVTNLDRPIACKFDEPELPQAVEEAIDWLVLIDSGEATDGDRRDLEAWASRSKANAEAWQNLSTSLAPFEVASRAPLRRGALVGRVLKTSVSRRNTLRSILGVGVLGALGAMVTNRFIPLDELTADQVTLTGQRKTLALPDGSSLVLGPRSAVDLEFGASTRRVSLREGEVMLKAKMDDRLPVIARTGVMTLQARGGTFVLRTRGRFTSVAAIDSPADLTCKGAQSLKLESGQCMYFDGARFVKRAAEVKMETDWVDGLLVVDNHSVGYVVSGLRPYFTGVIRVDPDVAALRVTGVFPLSTPLEALEMIGKTLNLTVTRTTPYWVSIGRGPTAPV